MAADSEILYAGILQHMQGGVLALDLEGRVRAFNPAAEHMLGLSAEGAMNSAFASLFFDDPLNDAFAQAVLDAIYEADDRHNSDLAFHRGDRTIWLNLTTSVLWTRPTGGEMPHKAGVVAVFVDITARKAAEDALRRANEDLELRVEERTRQLTQTNLELQREIAERIKAQEQLAHLAEHDALTGLPNRRLFEHRLAIAVAEAKGFSLLYLDLDGFKAVNDTHGHDMGDWLLQNVAKRLNSCIRDIDTLARLGGDEFAVIMESARTADEALAVVHRIIEHVAELYGAPTGVRLKIGVSVGIARHPSAGPALRELVQAADAAMYEAKRGGRGTWRMAPDADVLPLDQAAAAST